MALLHRFKNNKPAKEWLKLFRKRHPELRIRKANLLKRSRAAVSPDVVRDFFARYAKTAEGIPAEAVFNYDETNLTEDPGKFTLLVLDYKKLFKT